MDYKTRTDRLVFIVHLEFYSHIPLCIRVTIYGNVARDIDN